MVENSKNTMFSIGIILSVLLLSGCTGTALSTLSGSEQSELPKITIYKSPNCGCCAGHAAELQKQGFEVETVSTADTTTIKSKYNIPHNMQSCHTAVVGDYFVEGHVPIEVVKKLLEEKPDIDGIALPGMPAGSPGMPGAKKGPFTVYGLSNGKTTVFTTA